MTVSERMNAAAEHSRETGHKARVTMTGWYCGNKCGAGSE